MRQRGVQRGGQGSVAADGELSGRLKCRFAGELHEKGILSGKVLLSGSMNLTYNGIRRLEESILITDDTDAVARARHACGSVMTIPASL